MLSVSIQSRFARSSLRHRRSFFASTRRRRDREGRRSRGPVAGRRLPRDVASQPVSLRRVERRTVELRIAGQNYRVVSSAPEEDLQRLAQVVGAKLAELDPKGRPVPPQAMLLAAMALAHEVETVAASASRSSAARGICCGESWSGSTTRSSRSRMRTRRRRVRFHVKQGHPGGAPVPRRRPGRDAAREHLLRDRPARRGTGLVLSFCSNDYLGLAQRPPPAASGAGASRLVSGERPEHVELEGASARTGRAGRGARVYQRIRGERGPDVRLAGPADLVVSDA